MSSSLAQRLLRAADRLEEAFMVVALAFMTLLTFVQVVLRYGFGGGLVWSLEATTYTFAWLVLIGMSYGVRTDAHLAYCGLMIYGSAAFVERLMALGNDARDIPVPRWLLAGIMPVAFALLALRLVQAARSVFSRPAADGAR
jgi:C4-dicarboxylate transporter DctQ subunit